MSDDHSAPVDEDLNPHSREPEDLLLEDTEDDISISLYKETVSTDLEDDETFFINNILEEQYGGELPS